MLSETSRTNPNAATPSTKAYLYFEMLDIYTGEKLL